MNYTLHQGDCLEKMKLIPDGSVDMVMCDLPYGTTACKWDSVIPFEPLWSAYRRVCKKNAAIVLTASQPFTSALVMSNAKDFSYCLIWEKSKPVGHLNANRKPMNKHEDVVIFSQTQPTYHPQGLVEIEPKLTKRSNKGGIYGASAGKESVRRFTGFPHSILRFAGQNGELHPTQKPVALMEYLIKTYTNEGETVLDNTMGSGTTGVACMNINRRFIGIERDDKYFEIAKGRIEAAHKNYVENLL
jgi:site-specific DNA-methyltransferase (adenine-specific)